MNDELRAAALEDVLDAGWSTSLTDPSWKAFTIFVRGIEIARRELPVGSIQDKDLRQMTEQAAFQEAGLTLFRAWSSRREGRDAPRLLGADGFPLPPS